MIPLFAGYSVYQILTQTADFIIINKSPGISVHKDQGDEGLTMLLQRQLELDEIFLIHRLDKVTSGVMVFAKNRETAADLSMQFQNREVEKFYLAVSANKPKRKQGLVCGDMEKSRRGSWKLLRSKINPAMTQFVSVAMKPGFRLFLLKPSTGKTHQIRVALKSEGAPILGDNMYGGEEADRTYLHAYQLAFTLNEERYIFRALPTDGVHFDHQFSTLVESSFSQPEMENWPKLPSVKC
ncbi:RluA protein [Oceanospirillum sp. MED92]|uniref:RluA protein n=2 Tax=Neptuniibacter caesariensis TaxID=207954 RepID=A0A7U8C4G8_NEPCE|nr:RluA protein [Oceanospirillum sp. MED92] [Neptuniibacter caesariensis]